MHLYPKLALIKFKIISVKEFRRIHNCHQESFHRTLAKEYSRKNLKQYDFRMTGNKKCKYEEELCLPYSLPIDIPLCKTKKKKDFMKTGACYLQPLQKVEQELKNRSANFKTCKIKEFQVTGNSRGPSSEADLKLRISFR